ncbi:MAG: serine/threonine-protein kinase [Micrococcales bacterium]|nr:serine/threonine-protein kinase [Micrococcales bacterium]
MKLGGQQMPSLLGKTLAGRYEINEVIARGGMATVYLGTDSRLERMVAIKVIHPHLSEDPVFRDKFFREARMLAKVAHSNLVNIFDQGDDQGHAFIVLELVEGITLREALKDFGALRTEQTIQVSRAVLSALSQAHQNGVVHRDLKPENVLLADDGRIKVTDFGLARELTTTTDTGSLVGTVAYLAPEVIKRGKADTASDVYSFGILLFEMLTGKQPFVGDDAMQIAFMHTTGRVPSAKTINPDADSQLNELMLWCTEPLMENRPREAGVALAQLEKFSATTDRNVDDLAQTLLLSDVIPESHLTEVLSNVPRQEDARRPFSTFSSKLLATRWLIASLIALTAGSFGGWYFGVGPGALVPIPSLADKNQNQATDLLTELTTNISIKKVFSSTFAKGTVIGSEPGSGVLVPRGIAVTILVSKGKEYVSVPELSGVDLVTATAKILGARLAVGKVSEWFNSDYPIGSVYYYSGQDGTKLAVADGVDMKISLGSIPIVKGLQKNVAKAALEAAGLSVRKIVSDYSNSVAKGEVIAVVPDEPEIGKGSTIKLIVSLGPETVAMPQVKGETILAAKSLLESLGLKVVIDTKWLTKDYGIKRITGSSERVGTTLLVGQSVTIRAR